MDDDCEGAGCVIGFSNQTLGEKINLTGAPFGLRYNSERQRGRSSNRSLRLSLSGAVIPASLKRIDLTVSVAGRVFEQSLPAQPNQAATFLWDGLDAYGRVMQARQRATIEIGYVFDGVYQQSSRFGYNGNGTPITGNVTRQELTLWSTRHAYVGNFDDRLLDLGGWTIEPHHFYDPIERVLYEGNGVRRSVQAVSSVITTAAGTGGSGFSGDDGPATEATFSGFSPQGVAVAPDGSVYLADTGNRVIRRVAPNGIITTVAGTPGVECGAPTDACGDGGSALQARFIAPFAIAFGADGSYYVADPGANKVRKIAPNGTITTLAGTGGNCSSEEGSIVCGDEGPAADAKLNVPLGVAAAPDGAIYIGDSGTHRVRRVGPDGIITSIAGNTNSIPGGCSNNGVPALQGCLGAPFGVVAMPDGAVIFSDSQLNRLFRVGTNGILTVVAGDGVCGYSGDGGPATIGRLCTPEGITRGPDNAVYIADWSNNRIRRVGPDGILTTVAGTGASTYGGDGGPALAAQIRLPLGVAFAPDGSLYIADGNNYRLRRVAAPLPGFNHAEIAIPSADGSELYKFDSVGRHLQTIHALTNAVKYTFGYDAAGRLITITDGDNNITTIQRNGSGAPTGVLSPYNQLTTFTLDANGYFATIANPAGEQYQFTYTSGGLMTARRDPRNNLTSFIYDSLGRFIREDDAGGGSQTLTRTETGTNVTVSRATGLNRTLSVETQQLPTGDRQRNVTLPDGLQQILLERQNGTAVLTTPDGAITNTTLGPDPRWKMVAPLVTSSLTILPGGLNLGTTFSRTASFSGGDPLNLVSLTDVRAVNGRTYASAYTAATRTFAFAMPTGRAATRTIDGQGRTTAEQTANLAPASYGYDTRGRLATITIGSGPEARTASRAYDPGGFLASVTDALNRVTSFLYDGAGRVTQQTLADARVVGYGYDPAGNLTSITPPDRPAHTFTYNAMNLPATYTPPAVAGTGPTQYAYNIDQQLTTITQPGGATIAHAYDAAGRLSATTIAGGSFVYSYSATTGNLAGITAPNGPALAFAFDGSFPLGQTWSGAVAGSVGQTFNNFLLPATQSVNGANTISFAYDNDNLLTAAGSMTIARAAVSGLIIATALGNVTDARGDNAFGELTSYNASFGATPLYAFTATRDKLGRISQKTETLAGSTGIYEYGYDLAGRLQEVKLNGVTIGSYVYDGNGNRTNRNGVTGTHDAQDRLTAYGATTYSYTPNGELLTKTAAGQTTTYGYDALGNLRTAALPDGTQIEYLIDGLNRRVGKRVNGALTRGWLYQDPLKPVAELDGANNLVSRFVYGTRAQTPDYMIREGVTYRILTDHLGSVRLVVNTATGAVAQRIDYDEFGVVLLDTNPGFQPFGFAGGLYDPQTKLVRFGARDYDAETGRWTAKDPAGFFGGGTNLYVYAGNDPINSIDREGRKASPTDPVGLEIEMKGLQQELDRLNQEISQNADKCPTQEQLKKRMELEREIAEIKERLAALQKGAETKPPTKPPQESQNPGPLDYLKAAWDLMTGKSINTTITNATK
ncbi:MAG: RHS repeat-associated core domain-containing protein [Blastocatellia bacterium]|nr:RHS repeat-associated core domain-containing protein [Blastocatellia bacterium]